jgi:hypothetical protein
MSNAIHISPIEVLALKKLAIIGGALARQLSGSAAIEQRALVGVLIEVADRADLANKLSDAKRQNVSSGRAAALSPSREDEGK